LELFLTLVLIEDWSYIMTQCQCSYNLFERILFGTYVGWNLLVVLKH